MDSSVGRPRITVPLNDLLSVTGAVVVAGTVVTGVVVIALVIVGLGFVGLVVAGNVVIVGEVAACGDAVGVALGTATAVQPVSNITARDTTRSDLIFIAISLWAQD